MERAHPEPEVDLTYIKLASEPVGDAGDQYTAWIVFGRVADQRWRNSTDDIDSFFYTYDRNSNRTSKLNDLNSDFDETYEYDLLNQLVTFERADGHNQRIARTKSRTRSRPSLGRPRQRSMATAT